MSSSLISDSSQFRELCRHLRDSGLVAFDTEFVSEHTYRPELGLLQFATAQRCIAVDPYAVEDLSPWWEIMADSETTVIAHGGQAEIRFCLTEFGSRPQNLVDIQLAEGFRSGSYPLAYHAIVTRVLGKRIRGNETRTDWRKRPLSDRQLDYALEDVRYLQQIWRKQTASLKKRGRLEWLADETERMIEDIAADETRDAWRKLSKVPKLSRREMAVLHELAEWRRREAARRNRPLRQILRDDLVVELARRQPRSMKDLMLTRDMNRSSYQRSAKHFLECIERGLAVPEENCPQTQESDHNHRRFDDKAISQLLGLALANRCAELNISQQLVATTADLKEFIQWHNAGRSEPLPRITRGWRTEVCGNLLIDLLEGRLSVRVGDASSNHPLVFESAKKR